MTALLGRPVARTAVEALAGLRELRSGVSQGLRVDDGTQGWGGFVGKGAGREVGGRVGSAVVAGGDESTELGVFPPADCP